MKHYDVTKKTHGTFLKYLFLYNAVVLMILIRILRFGTRFTLKMAGYSYLNFENLSAFLRAPITILFLIGFLIMTSFLYLFEYVAMTIYYQTRKSMPNIRVAHILLPGIKEGLRLLKNRRNLLYPLFCFLCFLTSMYPVIIDMIMKVRIPSFLFQKLLHRPFVIAITVLVSILVVLVSVRGIFSFFYVAQRKMDFLKAYRKSQAIVRLRRKQIVWPLIKRNIVIWISYLLLYYLIVILSGFIVFFIADENMAAVIFLNIYDHINVVYAILGGIVGVNLNFYFIYELFAKYGEIDDDVSSYVCVLQRRITNNRKYVLGVQLISGIIVVLLMISTVSEYKNSVAIQRKALFGMNITSHRGYSSVAPENTLPSIQAAIDAMSDYVEIDVQQTKDGVIVLLHDTNLKRTTGVNKEIWNVTYEELKGYNAARNFKKGFEPTVIPTLEEALLLCQNNINMNIEIKINNHEQQLVEEVVQLIAQYHMDDQCIISSNNYGALQRVKNVNDQIKTGYIMTFSYGYLYNKQYLDFFSIKSSFVTQDMVALIHSYGKEVHAWTVNSIAEAERMKQMGVDNIITDHPIRIREIIFEDSLTSSFVKFMRTLMK